MVLVPKGFLGGDVGAVGPVRLAKGKVGENIKQVRVLKLGLELFDVGVEGFLFLLVKLLTSSVNKVVKGYLNKNVVKRGLGRSLKDEGGKRTVVVLEGGGGLGNVVLIDSVKGGRPRDGGR